MEFCCLKLSALVALTETSPFACKGRILSDLRLPKSHLPLVALLPFLACIHQ